MASKLPALLRDVLEEAGVIRPSSYPTMRRLEECFVGWGLTYSVGFTVGDPPGLMTGVIYDLERAEQHDGKGVSAEVALTNALVMWLAERKHDARDEQLALPGVDDDA